MKEHVSDWPEDFQQVFLDLHEHLTKAEITQVCTYEAKLQDHVYEVAEQLMDWEPEDWQKAAEYYDEMKFGTVFPPLIVGGGRRGLLRDGYHRCVAARLAGLARHRAIDLDAEVARQIAKQNAAHVQTRQEKQT